MTVHWFTSSLEGQFSVELAHLPLSSDSKPYADTQPSHLV
jgi:hypothetical protein